MKTKILGIAVLSALAACAWAQRYDILPPQRRAENVKEAQNLLITEPLPMLNSDALNPFNPPAFSRPDPTEIAALLAAQKLEESLGITEQPARSVRSTREILELIAPQITPSGTISLGGTAILLFGQKKVKVGDSLPITFEDEPYVLFITAIESTEFTLKLGGETITRPIKSSQ